MRTHTISVMGREVSCDDLTLVAGTVREDTARLELDAEWSGLDVEATFSGSGKRVTPELTDNTCVIPWECLADPGTVTVTVVGRRAGQRIAHASMRRPFVVLPSGVDDADPDDPTLSQWRAAYEAAKAATQAALDSRILYAHAETGPEGSEAEVTLAPEGEGQGISFTIPKGDRGDCDFATFEIDPETGDLSALYTTDHNEITFALVDGADLEVRFG